MAVRTEVVIWRGAVIDQDREAYLNERNSLCPFQLVRICQHGMVLRGL